MFMLSIFVLIAVFLVLILTFVKLLLSDYSVGVFSREEVSSYECGFEQYSLSRIPLSIRYFMLTLVFLIFDLEVMLLVFSPYDITLLVNKFCVSLISLFFILMLFFGLIFEWYDGSLEWIM